MRETDILVNGYRLSAIRLMKSEDIMLNMVTVVDNTVISVNFAKILELKYSHSKKDEYVR